MNHALKIKVAEDFTHCIKTGTTTIGKKIISLAGILLAIIFGTIAITKIKQYPKNNKGKGFAFAASVVGIVFIADALLILSITFG